ncbi:MAG: outer membrane protein transport protein [Deltaproteobacteria bacterium]|nr:outer membrane protein transport protein [Deltaproteobacteria bacterium]
MQKRFILTIILALCLVPPAMATNGSNLIGVGPMSRSMGGVGVAAPQDAIGAIFANPAAICFGPFCPGAEADFAGTYFSPSVDGKAKVTVPTGNPSQPYTQVKGSDTSEMDPSVVPAIGISTPLSPKWRFGVGAYGVSGMGVSYKESDLPLPGNIYTKLEVMNFAPNLAYLINPNFSVGANAIVSYQNLDLGYGADHGYSMGFQLGGLYKLGIINLGASYTYHQGVTHNKVAYLDDYDASGNLTADATLDDLELQSPQVVALGVALEPGSSWLVEVNTRWINWSNANGYKDFDWEDQWVFALGAQYKLTDAFSLRAGYNYAKNPVKEHDGFNPMGSTDVQGHDVGNVNYEALRILGFPAVVEHHITLGAGYKFSTTIALNLAYVHALENTTKESSAGDAFSFESSLKEDTVTLGLTWFF